MRHSAIAPLIVLVCASTFWGLSWIPLKFFRTHGVHGGVFIFLTHLILLSLILPWGFKLAELRANKKFLFGVAAAGGLGISTFTYALIYGDVVRVMVLFYLLPIWGVLGGRIFLHERIDAIRWLGVGLGIPGAFLVLGGFQVLDTPPSWIDLLALISGMAFALNNILFRGVGHVALSVKLLAMFAGCVALTGLSIAVGVESFPVAVESWVWLALIFYAAVALMAANLGSQWAIERMEAGRSSIIIIVQLLAAVTSAMVLGGERLNSAEWLGFVLVLSAALIEAQRDAFKSKAKPQTCTLE